MRLYGKPVHFSASIVLQPVNDSLRICKGEIISDWNWYCCYRFSDDIFKDDDGDVEETKKHRLYQTVRCLLIRWYAFSSHSLPEKKKFIYIWASVYNFINMKCISRNLLTFFLRSRSHLLACALALDSKIALNYYVCRCRCCCCCFVMCLFALSYQYQHSFTIFTRVHVHVAFGDLYDGSKQNKLLSARLRWNETFADAMRLHNNTKAERTGASMSWASWVSGKKGK